MQVVGRDRIDELDRPVGGALHDVRAGAPGRALCLEEALDRLRLDLPVLHRERSRLPDADAEEEIEHERGRRRQHQGAADEPRERHRRGGRDPRKDLDRHAARQRQRDDQRPPRIQKPRHHDLQALTDINNRCEYESQIIGSENM